ncbi:MAG: protein-L-isoaspartate(D-aspartate) O-methyltransferase [Planctomycetes bacterium]|nr:protein-L-isoaspartate(D-aspartate) O-methyltransferase [Planctomycetota bacterium]
MTHLGVWNIIYSEGTKKMNAISNEVEKLERQRADMVQYQLRDRGIRDERVLEAMGRIRREEFTPPSTRRLAYYDGALPIGEGQTISQPYMVASMTSELHLAGDEKVLEIGTGSGYQTAVLASIAKSVYTIERIRELHSKAVLTLIDLGFRNVSARLGDGTQGWEEAMPFDGIIVTAGAPRAPEKLMNQLADGGRLVIPIGDRRSQSLTIFTRKGKTFECRETFLCTFVPLIGDDAWESN